MKIRLFNARILTMEENRPIFRGEVHTTDELITYVGEETTPPRFASGNKARKDEGFDREMLEKHIEMNWPVVGISAKTGQGLDKLAETVGEMFFEFNLDAENHELITNERHAQAVKNALESLKLAYETAVKGLPPDLVSIDLTAAYESLGEITGESFLNKSAGEDIIESIFATFCLGK